MDKAYQQFLESKKSFAQDVGKEINAADIHPTLFMFQRDIVAWAVKKGRAAIFADVGLGKTAMQLEWARQIGELTLILAPLAVAQQTVNEARKLLDMEVRYVRKQADVKPDECRVYITNYEMLEHFDAAAFGAVVLDESSILKNFSGKTKKELIRKFSKTPYRLCCTATPAPNDITELGNHAEFLGVMSNVQMLSIFFTYDSDELGSDAYRLKRHARTQFYQWLASWAVALKKPSDVGDYDDTGYILPELEIHVHTVNANYTPDGMLPGFGYGKISATDAKRVRRETISARAQQVIDMINPDRAQWVVWTGLNDESTLLDNELVESVNVHGSLPLDEKVAGIQAFVGQNIRNLISKTSIAGMGINMQHCHKMLFFGIDYSWEQFYQAVGRILRFGQKSASVEVHIITSEEELSVWQVVEKKGEEAKMMTQELIDASRAFMTANIQGKKAGEWKYAESEAKSELGQWRLLLGDSCERMKEIADNSVDLSIYSPPFSDIFVYSSTERDLGNSRTLDEFFTHYEYIIRENLRITKPGRLAAVHVMDTRMMKQVEGTRGRKDFSGMVIEAYQKEGWIFWERITIDKNPQAQAIRMKDHGLLFKTLKKDSLELSGGHADYVLVFKKPGKNEVPVLPIDNGEMTAEDWILWAHPVWYGIVESNTLNVQVARGNDDEKHMCPLQLDLIERVIKLWSNPGELVFSPFAGIGSELYEAIKWRRHGLGIELKPEYFRVAINNLNNAERLNGKTLFDLLDEQQAGD